jgi:trimethylamine--corrinoid protein Co-methyltransferase
MARRSHREKRTVNAIRQLPCGKLVNPYPPIEMLSADQVETIIETALNVLSSQGMRFLEPGSRKLLREAGANVDEASNIVRFDPDLVRENVALAPASFELRARNPAHDLKVGGNNIIFGSVGGPAFCSDFDKGRRPGNYAEQCDYLRLIQSLNVIQHEGGGPFEAMDLPGETRHLDLYLAQHRFLDKNCQANALGRERTIDAIEMTCIAF